MFNRKLFNRRKNTRNVKVASCKTAVLPAVVIRDTSSTTICGRETLIYKTAPEFLLNTVNSITCNNCERSFYISRKRRLKWVVTLPLGDINTEARSSGMGVGRGANNTTL
jgi:hypothetical protein